MSWKFTYECLNCGMSVLERSKQWRKRVSRAQWNIKKEWTRHCCRRVKNKNRREWFPKRVENTRSHSVESELTFSLIVINSFYHRIHSQLVNGFNEISTREWNKIANWKSFQVRSSMNLYTLTHVWKLISSPIDRWWMELRHECTRQALKCGPMRERREHETQWHSTTNNDSRLSRE